MRLVQVRVAPQRSVSIGQRAPAVHDRRPFVHAPGDLKPIYFMNSGSEAVDTVLKIALVYRRSRGEGQRTTFIGRERGYHGVGFDGISVGGYAPDRKTLLFRRKTC